MKNFQPHELRFLNELEHTAVTTVSSDDASMLIRIWRRHHSSKDAFVVADNPWHIEASILNNHDSIFVQNGRFHKDIATVDMEHNFLVIYQTSRETLRGAPIAEVYAHKVSA